MNTYASTNDGDWQGYSNYQKFHEFVNKDENKTAGWEMTHFPAALACETYGNRTIDQDGQETTAYDWQKPLVAPKNTSGWFLPSCGQLKYLYQHSTTLSACMEAVENSTPAECDYKDKIKWFSTSYFYWSSTENSSYPYYARDVRFDYGNASSSYKEYPRGVRAVLAF